MKKGMKFIGVIIIVMVVALITAPSQEEKEAELKAEIQKIEKEVSSIPALEVEKNRIAYMKLSEYYPANEDYKRKHEFYKNLESVEDVCFSKSRKLNKDTLMNKDSYDENYDRVGKWVSPKEFITSSSFTGSNKLNMKFTFKAQYKCTITSQGLRIKQTYLKQI